MCNRTGIQTADNNVTAAEVLAELRELLEINLKKFPKGTLKITYSRSDGGNPSETAGTTDESREDLK